MKSNFALEYAFVMSPEQVQKILKPKDISHL